MDLTGFDDTVFALSTPVGGAIAVIRASGKLSLPVLKRIFTGKTEHGFLSHGKIRGDGDIIDDAMAVYFKSPRSYTGEDMFELHIHGSYAVADAAAGLLRKNGLRPAKAGEFTKRAFLNGKMDLVQADAVMDLINAETEKARNAALEQLEGDLSRRIHKIEEGLLDTASALAAALDYPEETEEEVLSSVPEELNSAITELNALINEGKASKILREGAKIVILGRPNVGKSSLLNILTGSESAIVTAVAGTTRDIIEANTQIKGVPVRLIDTAGIHRTSDAVESIGIDRAMKKAKAAELVLLLFDGSEALTEEDMALIAETKRLPHIFVINKLDRNGMSCDKMKRRLREIQGGTAGMMISCRTSKGISALMETVAEALGISEERALVTNQRHIECMENAVNELENAKSARFADIILSALSSALMCLGEITGREFSEALLDKIFERFCVGK